MSTAGHTDSAFSVAITVTGEDQKRGKRAMESSVTEIVYAYEKKEKKFWASVIRESPRKAQKVCPPN